MTASGIRYTPLVASLPSTVPFVGAETQERAMGQPFAARLGANESVFGPSPKAIEAIKATATENWQYCDPENHDLKIALAELHKVAPENIVVGEGIDGLLGYLARMLISDGTPVVTSLGAYPTFNFHVAGFGGKLETVPFLDDREDPEALIAKANEVDPALIYFSNPDNPMGTWHDAQTVNGLIDAVPDGSLLILDEAYIEFAPEGTAPAIDVSNERVIRMRTFSKAHGMAGLRIGYAIAHHELATAFNKVRNHFGVSRVAQQAALASIGDPSYLTDVVESVSQARVRISEIAATNGLQALPSATNFVAIDCKKDGGFAKAVLDQLVASGIFVRMPFVEPQNRCIRVSAGKPADLDAFEAALPKALAKAESLLTKS